jgi:WD40 repeat protein
LRKEAVPPVNFRNKTREAPKAMAFSRDGKRLAAAFGETVVVYDIAGQQELQTIKVHPLYAANAIAFTADGNGIITCQSRPILWDSATGKIVRHFGPFTDVCETVDVSPDGKYAVTGSWGGTDVRIWEIETGVFERRLGTNLKSKG